MQGFPLEILRTSKGLRTTMLLKFVWAVIGWNASIFAYVFGECIDPVPTVANSFTDSSGSPPFPDGTTVKFTCTSGYTGSGNSTYECVNGTWNGNFECVRVCRYIDNLDHGKIVNKPSYKVGSRIAFACDTGYKMVGDSSLLCRASGEWRPDPPTCQIVTCGVFGNVQNGATLQVDIDGQNNVYGSKIEVTCEDTYILEGSPTVTCKADGTWGTKPNCRLSSCGSHPGVTSSCIDDISLSLDATIISFLCKEPSSEISVTEVGTGTDFCENDRWEEPETACYCDCKIESDFTIVVARNLQQHNFLKHNQTLLWDCGAGYRKENNAAIHCFDGKISSPLPQCVEIPTTTTTNRHPETSASKGDVTYSHMSTIISTPPTDLAKSSRDLVIGLSVGVVLVIAFIIGAVIFVLVFVLKKDLCSYCNKKSETHETAIECEKTEPPNAHVELTPMLHDQHIETQPGSE